MKPTERADLVKGMSPAEIRSLFNDVFGTVAGQKVLLFILAHPNMGGIGELHGPQVSEARQYFDGRRECALEVARWAGISPYHLAQRIMDVNPLTKDLDNETEVPEADVRPRRPAGRAARSRAAGSTAATVPASAIATSAPTIGDD